MVDASKHNRQNLITRQIDNGLLTEQEQMIEVSQIIQELALFIATLLQTAWFGS